MRRLVVLAGIVAVLAGPVARAGTVCANGTCQGAPGVHGRVTVSPAGTVKVDGGLDGGPGLAPTGLQSTVVKPDNVALKPVVHGQEFGRVGYAFGSGILWVYLGPRGCRQSSDHELLAPCHNPDAP